MSAPTASRGLRRYVHSKDHRPDLPQVVIGLAVTKEGIWVRVWSWRGNTSDTSVLPGGPRRDAGLAARPGRHGRRPSEARHRQRARCEDRIRDAKDTGLDRLPYADAPSNTIWLQIVLLAIDLTTWTQQLALTGEWRLARPRTLRIRLFANAARHITASRRRIIDLDPDWPCVTTVHDALKHLAWVAKLAPA